MVNYPFLTRYQVHLSEDKDCDSNRHIGTRIVGKGINTCYRINYKRVVVKKIFLRHEKLLHEPHFYSI